MKNKVTVVGMGPGDISMMTPQAKDAIESGDVIVGYTVYLELIRQEFPDKRFMSTGMRQEQERCRLCFEEAAKGSKVVLVCSGDAGIYGMAALMYEIGEEYPDTGIEIIAGITAASSGAALLGAPINNDFCVISLSDQLTPWEKIAARLKAAAEADFAIVLYNPGSHGRAGHLKAACDILLQNGAEEDRACGLAENIGREGTYYEVCTIKELREKEVNMFTTVFIGSSQTGIMSGRLITKRGYRL